MPPSHRGDPLALRFILEGFADEENGLNGEFFPLGLPKSSLAIASRLEAIASRVEAIASVESQDWRITSISLLTSVCILIGRHSTNGLWSTIETSSLGVELGGLAMRTHTRMVCNDGVFVWFPCGWLSFLESHRLPPGKQSHQEMRT